MKRRVAITGYGIISSLGNNCSEVLLSLQNNTSGIKIVPEWTELGFRSCIAGLIKLPDIDEIRQKIGMKSKYMGLPAIYIYLSTMEAIKKSNLSFEQLSTERTGCVIGSGFCFSEPICRNSQTYQGNKKKSSPYDITLVMSSSCCANIANILGIKGRSYAISSACATSLHNIGHGYELISNNICDTVIAGGAEEVSTVLTSMFNGMRTVLSSAYNNKPEKASRPYDKNRDGFVISGGGGVVILEDMEHANNRDAKIYGEIIGYGTSSDGYHMIESRPDADGQYRSMKEALKVAKCSPAQIDYINTHATSTITGDIVEVNAIDKLFGNNKIPFSSTKSLSGHSIGAAGIHELIYCLLMMENNFICASTNIEELDPIFKDMNIITKNKKIVLKKVLTNSFGFGGTNASIIIQVD